MWWCALTAGLAAVALALTGQDVPYDVPATLIVSSASAAATSSAGVGQVVGPAAPAASSSPRQAEPGEDEQSEAVPEQADDRVESDRGGEHAPAVQGTDPSAAAPAPSGPPEPAPDDGPVSLSIPTIGVTSVLNHLGLNTDGTLEVPARGPHYDEAAWFHGSPEPGEVGPAVLLGHVNGTGGTPSVFYDLAQLSEGDLVDVTDGDGSTSTFEVYLTQRYPKDRFPTMAVYGDTEGPELRLITCGGVWDSATGHYRDNTVVYARVVTS